MWFRALYHSNLNFKNCCLTSNKKLNDENEIKPWLAQSTRNIDLFSKFKLYMSMD